MKAVASNESCNNKYPKLMMYPSSGNIVLWVNKEKGTYVYAKAGNSSRIGDIATCNTGWKDYQGSVCLENS